MPFRLLIVDTDAASRAAIERMLTTAGNLVTSVGGFEDGQQRLIYAPPDLLVTAVKLGAHNGLHLVLRAHADYPDMPAIVVHTKRDEVLEAEAAGAGATYVTMPFDEEQFKELVDDLLSSSASRPSAAVPRRWPRKQVIVRARVGDNEAKVVDVSYGGLRLEIRSIDHPLSHLATIDIPRVGVVAVHPVWARGGGALGRWWCGAEVDPNHQTSDVWRQFVDSLS